MLKMSKYLGSDDFQKDMKEFETRLKKLRAEYNQYIAGVLKSPPTFAVAMIRKIVRKYAGDRSLKGMQKFKYYNLVAKFNTMMEFYNRRLKQIQNGQQTTFGYIKDSDKTVSQARDKAKQIMPPPVDKGHIISNVNRQQATMKNMFEKWNEYASHVGSVQHQMDYDKFSKIINHKTQQLLEAKQCKAVRYKLTVQNGKIKIQAKPIK